MARSRSHTRRAPRSMPRGTLVVHAEGYGFVRTAEGEYFIPSAKLGGAFDGDVVEVAPLSSAASKAHRSSGRDAMRTGGRPAARVVRVVERAHETLIGRYEVADPFGVVIPEDPRIPYDIFTQRSAVPDIPHGALVRVRISTYPSRNTAATGVVEEVLGEADEPRIGVESIIARHKLETRFSDACLKEADGLRLDVEAALSRGYVDLRDRCVFTIDPVDARDFDDALSLEWIAGDGSMGVARERVGDDGSMGVARERVGDGEAVALSRGRIGDDSAVLLRERVGDDSAALSCESGICSDAGLSVLSADAGSGSSFVSSSADTGSGSSLAGSSTDTDSTAVLSGSGWENAGAAVWRLGVHIADVSAYVPWGSSIDLDARSRATSAYLVDRVIPMLPERLSNDLCSLRPDEDRLSMTVDLYLDGKSRVNRYEIYPAVIRSKARLTYDAVQEWLDGFGSSGIAPRPDDADAPFATDASAATDALNAADAPAASDVLVATVAPAASDAPAAVAPAAADAPAAVALAAANVPTTSEGRSPYLLRLSGQKRAENGLEMSRTPQKLDLDAVNCPESLKTTSYSHVDCPKDGKTTCSSQSDGREEGHEAAGRPPSAWESAGRSPYACEAAGKLPSACEAAPKAPRPHGAGIPRQVADRLAPLSRIGKLRAELRRRAGGIDFPSTEAKVRLDADGRPTGVDLRRKTDATSLVEEAMILANEAVAHRLVAADSPALFRVHERPAADGLAGLIPVLEEFDWFTRIDKTRFALGDPHAVQAALEASRGRSEGELVGSLLLRAMKRADYRPSCEGHYGLASEAYAHFTSPIRRYPDLVVHHMLKALLFGRSELHDQEASALRWLGRHCSEREREADAAARESQELKLIELMESQVGEAFSGVVSGVAPYGLYVRLDNTAEGLLPVRRLGTEYYSLDAELHRLVGQDSGRTWRLGQRVAVLLTLADARRHVLEFRLAGEVR